MYYQFSDKFKLVSYKGFPYGIYIKENHEVFFIHDKEFYLLLYKCDGRHDIDEDKLSERQKNGFEELADLGVLIKLEEPLEKPVIIESSFHKCAFRREVHWSITGECNYKCRHCFQSAPEGVLGSPSFEQLLDIIRQMKECGIHQVSLTGGEPLIREDFFDIVDACLENEITISTIYSNGSLITQAFIDELKKRKLNCGFQISFDGVGFHDWMRGIDGAEDQAIEAMKLLKENKIGFGAAMCLCKENSGVVKETALKLAEAGAGGLKVQKTMPQGEWVNEGEHFLTNEETMELYEDLIKWYAEEKPAISLQTEGVCVMSPPVKGGGKYTASLPMELKTSKEKLNVMPSCGVLISSFFIGPNGATTPCMSMCGAAIESIFPNMFETPLSQILTDSELIKMCRATRGEILDANPRCHDCPDALNCCGGMCRALAVGEDKTDFLCIDEFACWFYKSGWHKKIRELVDELFDKPDDTAQEIQC